MRARRHPAGPGAISVVVTTPQRGSPFHPRARPPRGQHTPSADMADTKEHEPTVEVRLRTRRRRAARARIPTRRGAAKNHPRSRVFLTRGESPHPFAAERESDPRPRPRTRSQDEESGSEPELEDDDDEDEEGTCPRPRPQPPEPSARHLGRWHCNNEGLRPRRAPSRRSLAPTPRRRTARTVASSAPARCFPLSAAPRGVGIGRRARRDAFRARQMERLLRRMTGEARAKDRSAPPPPRRRAR